MQFEPILPPEPIPADQIQKILEELADQFPPERELICGGFRVRGTRKK